jgi:hypothetical protein
VAPGDDRILAALLDVVLHEFLGVLFEDLVDFVQEVVERLEIGFALDLARALLLVFALVATLALRL